MRLGAQHVIEATRDRWGCTDALGGMLVARAVNGSYLCSRTGCTSLSEEVVLAGAPSRDHEIAILSQFPNCRTLSRVDGRRLALSDWSPCAGLSGHAPETHVVDLIQPLPPELELLSEICFGEGGSQWWIEWAADQTAFTIAFAHPYSDAGFMATVLLLDGGRSVTPYYFWSAVPPVLLAHVELTPSIHAVHLRYDGEVSVNHEGYVSRWEVLQLGSSDDARMLDYLDDELSMQIPDEPDSAAWSRRSVGTASGALAIGPVVAGGPGLANLERQLQPSTEDPEWSYRALPP